MSEFFKLHPVLREVLVSGLKWNSLREVQEMALAAVARGEDILVLAPTAGGKTEAAFLPVIDSILKNPSHGLSAIYVSPLKALINDQTDRVVKIATRAGLTVAVQHGDVSRSERWKFGCCDFEDPDILLTTPESLEVLLSGDAKKSFSAVRFIIIDEIHAFIESSRGVHLRCLIDRLTFASKNHVGRIGLSATVGNPDALLNWMSAATRKKQVVKAPSPPSKKAFSFVVEDDFYRRVDAVARAVRGKKSLVFVESRSFAERLLTPLQDTLTSVFVHHSAVSSEDRSAAESSFSNAGETCVICTSTMELGVDIGSLDLVVQMGAPTSVASFLQRLGRTGRRGEPAQMLFVVESPCEFILSLAAIESAMQHVSESLLPPAFPADVLAQQLFILLKGKTGLGKSQIISSITALTPFSKVSTDAISDILEYLLGTEYLARDGDLYIIGTRAEAEFGRSNWRSLISVIPDSGEYLAVLTDGTVVGTLDARFVAGDSGKTFTFTGRKWRLLHRDDLHHRALIEPSTSQKGNLSRPFWGGSSVSMGENYTPLLCEAVGKILSRQRTLLPLLEADAEILNELLSSLPRNFVQSPEHIRTEPEVNGWSVVVSTFAGMGVNRVIAMLLRNRLDRCHEFKVTPFAIRVFGFEDSMAGDVVSDVLLRIEDTFDSSELPELPDNAWKFGALLPKSIKKEMALLEYYKIDYVFATIKKLRASVM